MTATGVHNTTTYWFVRNCQPNLVLGRAFDLMNRPGEDIYEMTDEELLKAAIKSGTFSDEIT